MQPRASHKRQAALAIIHGMNKKTTRQTLATNLEWLMHKHEIRQPALGRKSGVPQRTISHMLNPDGPQPRLENVDRVAKAFGLNGWQLIHPSLPEIYAALKDLNHLIEDYSGSDEEGQATIRRVAESVSKYGKTG